MGLVAVELASCGIMSRLLAQSSFNSGGSCLSLSSHNTV